MKSIPGWVAGFFALVFIGTPSAHAKNILTVEDVIRLVNAGVSSDLISSEIRVTDSVFELTADDIIQLVEAGTPEEVVQLMIDSSWDSPSNSETGSSNTQAQGREDSWDEVDAHEDSEVEGDIDDDDDGRLVVAVTYRSWPSWYDSFWWDGWYVGGWWSPFYSSAIWWGDPWYPYGYARWGYWGHPYAGYSPVCWTPSNQGCSVTSSGVCSSSWRNSGGHSEWKMKQDRSGSGIGHKPSTLFASGSAQSFDAKTKVRWRPEKVIAVEDQRVKVVSVSGPGKRVRPAEVRTSKVEGQFRDATKKERQVAGDARRVSRSDRPGRRIRPDAAPRPDPKTSEVRSSRRPQAPHGDAVVRQAPQSAKTPGQGSRPPQIRSGGKRSSPTPSVRSTPPPRHAPSRSSAPAPRPSRPSSPPGPRPTK